MVRCLWCHGRGWLNFGGKDIPCDDCKGQGYHNDCLGCHGSGRLWLGGDDYLDCPACNGTGGILPKRRYIVPKGIEVAQRNPAREK